jgi:hypothetical protein
MPHPPLTDTFVHVVPGRKGVWTVRGDGGAATSVHGSATEAERAAHDYARVRGEPDALAAVSGLRAPGLAVPGRTKIGVWRGRGRRTRGIHPACLAPQGVELRAIP